MMVNCGDGGDGGDGGGGGDDVDGCGDNCGDGGDGCDSDGGGGGGFKRKQYDAFLYAVLQLILLHHDTP